MNLIFSYTLLLLLLFSCGTNNFAKRKYTKGVYVEKRSRGTTKTSKRKDLKTKNSPVTSLKTKEQKRNEISHRGEFHSDAIHQEENEYREDFSENEVETITIEEAENLANKLTPEEQKRKKKNLDVGLGCFISGIGAIGIMYALNFALPFVPALSALAAIIGIVLIIVGIIFFARYDKLKKKEKNKEKTEAYYQELARKGAIISYVGLGIVLIAFLLFFLVFFSAIAYPPAWGIWFGILLLCGEILGITSIVLGAIGRRFRTKNHDISLYIGIACLAMPLLVFLVLLVIIFL